jgi:undecaprenyl diphosphate synthase
MDGNGRWAERAGLSRSKGHVAGARAMRDVVSHCAKSGIEQLTVYAFSSDNWSRPAAEVGALLELFTSHFRSEAETLERNGIRVSVIGQRHRLPLVLRHVIAHAESRTARGTAMHLRVAIDYSSRAAIEQSLAGNDNDARPSTDPILPPVDLLLRTGGERRLSDFLLWECAYAELLFLDVLWPDITADHLDAAFADFARRDRRFGNVPQRASA